MKKDILNKLMFILLAVGVFLLLLGIKSNAASLSISTSKSSVSPGEKFSVTVSASGGAGYANLSVSNGTLSSTSIDLMLQSSVTVTCTAGSSGSVTIRASGTIADYTTEKDESKSASKTVKIVKTSPNNTSGGSSSKPQTSNNSNQSKKSTDSSLSALTVKEGAITPEFSKDVKEYSLVVPNGVTSLDITATPTDSKATVSVEGNKELKEGENAITVTVKAEDGTTTNYVIKVTRKKPELALQTIVIKYTNQNGEEINIPLEPEFAFDKYEYTLQNLEYWVKKLNVEATANIEGAIIDIKGNENLQEGENVITITVKLPVENKEQTEEKEIQEQIKTYTIKVNKETPPTLMGRIKNWFNGIFGGVVSWYNQNQEKAIMGALGICIIALLGLSIYIVVDYNKYKDIIAKLKKVNEINNAELINDTIDSENNIESIYNKKKQNINVTENIELQNNNENLEDNNKKIKHKGGRHF